MKLTVEENPETIKRYGHVRPARRWGGGRCSLALPHSRRRCTLARGHRGPHVAHGLFSRVLAVWDAGGAAPARVSDRRAPRRRRPEGVETRGLGRWLGRVFAEIRRRPEHFIEKTILLGFTLAMTGFVLDWLLRIMGWR